MIFTLGMTGDAKQDYQGKLRNSDDEDGPVLRRAYRELLLEKNVDGPNKGAVAPYDPSIRALEHELGVLRVIDDVQRAKMDRFITCGGTR
jgi:hypothetical protein